MKVRVVTNHWGWNPKGILTWIKYGWSFKPVKWYVETPPKNCRKLFCFVLITKKANMEDLSLEQLRDKKNKLAEELANIDSVIGIGITPEASIKVNLKNEVEGLPQEIEGVPIKYQVVGEVKPLSNE